MRRFLSIVTVLLFCTAALFAQQPDTLLKERLDSAVFVSERSTSIIEISPSRPIYVNTDQLRKIPSVTGSPDPIRMVRLLPGVQTGSELDAGLHILGTENSHSLVSVDNVPVYGATHLLGLFSTFISSHYSGMTFSPYYSTANRLGGSVDMQLPRRVPSRLRGQLSASLFAAEGTLDIPTSKNSALFVSARRSYINLLYSGFLRLEMFYFKYGFTDGNVTWYWAPGKNDRVWVDFLMAGDNLKLDSSRGGYNLKLDWINGKGSVHHRHKWDWGELHQGLYYTRMNLAMDFTHDIYNLYVPSVIGTAGYFASLNAGRWQGEVRIEGHHSKPQQTVVRNKDISSVAKDESQAALEASAKVQYTWPVTPNFDLSASLKGIWWSSADGANYPALVPELKLGWDLYSAGKFEFVAGLGRQNLFQTGVTSIGLPVEFWYLSGKNFAPQDSQHAYLSWGRGFMDDRYSVSVSAFYRHLTNQIEYTGTIIDYLNPDFTTPKYIKVGFGQNYGLCLTLHKQSGSFTGWINYTLSRSLRTFDGITYPSNHERIHEFNVVGNYTVGRWDFGGVMVFASGLPFTAADSFIMSGGMIIAEMSPKNSARMNPYFRLDLSASYYFRRSREGRGHGLTFSMYNVTGYKNALTMMPVTSEDEKAFAYGSMSLYLRFLPSISYFYKF